MTTAVTQDTPRSRVEPAARPARPFIETVGLSLRYGGTTALEDVSLPVPAGAVTVLVGPSGSGKSSLLTALNRLTDLIPGCRVSGEIRVGGEPVKDLDPVALRRRVGMIFQKPNPFPMSIRRNLALPLREHGIRDRREIARRSREALVAVGLWDEVNGRPDHPAPTLSGGQQQRLCIARALALEPEALLLDEPTSSLDPLATARVEALVTGLKGRYTVLLVTHDLAQARRLADFAGLLWAGEGPGRLVEFGTARRVLENPEHPLTAAYLNGGS